MAFPKSARAEDRFGRDARDWRARNELALAFHPGTFSDGHGAGVHLGADVTYRRGLLAVGVLGDRGTTTMTPYTVWTGAGAAGLSAPLPSWVRFDLVGVAGVHSYTGVGSTAYLTAHVSNRSGSEAVLPFVGSRLRLATEVGAKTKVLVGVEGFAETDASRVTAQAETTRSPFGQRSERATNEVGTERLGAAFTLGGAFSL